MYTESIKDKIHRFYLINAIIPLAIIVILFSLFSFFNVRFLISRTADRTAQKLQQELSAELEAYRGAVSELSSSQELTDFLTDGKQSERIFSTFYEANKSFRIKSTMVILGSREGLLLTSSAMDLSVSDVQALKQVVPRLERSKGTILEETLVIPLSFQSSSAYCLSKAIIDGQEILGYLFVLMHADDLLDFIFDAGVNITAVTDQFDTLVATTNSRLAGMLNKFRPQLNESGTLFIDTDAFYLSSIPVEDSLLTIHVLNARRIQKELLLWLPLFVISIIVLVSIMLRRLADTLTIQTTRPIDTMIQAISQLQEGNTKAFVSIDSHDEFELLAVQYNRMLERINTLMEENLELVQLTKETELKLLESQFNPHFMFNMLECIRYEIELKPQKAQQTILRLSRLLRYSVRGIEDSVPLSQELQYLEDYLALHEVRVNERLSYHFEFESSLKELMIPRLLLQPLVENAVKYGLQEKRSLSITISGSYQQESGCFQFTVRDTGGGIEEERLQQIRRMLEPGGVRTSETGSGIYNLNRRLCLLYGELAHLWLENTSTGLVTTIMIREERLDTIRGQKHV